jgi:hypothetical protein
VSQLDKDILEYLANKTGKTPKTIKNRLSVLHQKYQKCTMNAVAQIFSLENGFSILKRIKKEDKATLPNLEIEPQSKITVKKLSKKKNIPDFIVYDSKDYFIKGHIKELNSAYAHACYTSAFILIRKIVENLLIDILRKKFPESSNSGNRELYYNNNLKRAQDFSVIIENLYKKRNEFGNKGEEIIRRINGLVKKLKKDTNYTVHSWFHLVEKKAEFEELSIHQIIELIIRLEKLVGLR